MFNQKVNFFIITYVYVMFLTICYNSSNGIYKLWQLARRNSIFKNNKKYIITKILEKIETDFFYKEMGLKI